MKKRNEVCAVRKLPLLSTYKLLAAPTWSFFWFKSLQLLFWFHGPLPEFLAPTKCIMVSLTVTNEFFSMKLATQLDEDQRYQCLSQYLVREQHADCIAR